MTNKPLESFYAGNVEVAVWENQGEDSKVFHSVSAKRTYMDSNGQWKEAGTVHLLPQQIPDMVMALQKSHEYLRMGMRQRRKQQSAAADEPCNGLGNSAAPNPDSSSSNEALTETQAELAGTGASEQGFVGKVGQSRAGSKRSR